MNFQGMKKLFLRVTAPVIDIKQLINSINNIFRYCAFFLEFRRYKAKSNETIRLRDIWPCLNDRNATSQSGGGHYFYQDIWALQKIAETRPEKHVDIGSRIDGFVGQCTAITQVEFLDLRYVDFGLKGLQCRKGDILNLPYADNSVLSLSCLNVVEHIGLGRYGDEFNPQGTLLSIKELQRVLAVNGNLYFSVPIGFERVQFNAHRIFNPCKIISLFDQLKLNQFSLVDDEGRFVTNTSPEKYREAVYSCGLFHFRK